MAPTISPAVRDGRWDLRDDKAAGPRIRLICLGASNIARGLSLLVGAAEAVWPGPLDLMIAGGHGRSYGMTSWVLGRQLPGILPCGLWDQLAARPAAQTFALVTDIGNDLVYGAGPGRTASWVQGCLRRLSLVCERIVVSRLPMDSLGMLGAPRYRIMRRLLFPRSRLTFADLRLQVAELNARVEQLAAGYSAVLCSQPASWFGWDPIHVRRRCRAAAWHAYLTALCTDADAPQARGSLRRCWALRGRRPLFRRWFGIAQRQPQPCCVLQSGTQLSLY